MGAGSAAARRQYLEMAAELRERGVPVADIARSLRERFSDLQVLASLRYANGWSQHEAAERWNRKWPGWKTFKDFNSWESGRRKPLDENLERLAEVYGCDLARLAADLVTENRPTSAGNRLAPVARSAEDRDSHYGEVGQAVEAALTPVIPLLGSEELDMESLTALIVKSAQRAHLDISRRDVLLKLGTAVALATAAPVFNPAPALGAGGSEGPGGVGGGPEGLVDHTRTMTLALRHQADLLGPQAPLRTALSQRSLLGDRLSEVSSARRDEAISTYAEICQLTGWLAFNLGDATTAMAYYEEARDAAHEARDAELVTYVLCTMAHLQTWADRPRVGIDHAVAATNWARQTGSAQAKAYAADVSARAHAAAGDRREALAALEQEHEAFALVTTNSSPRSWWYFFDQSFPSSTETEAALSFGDTDRAHATIATSLACADEGNLADYSTKLLFRAEALALDDDIPQACQVVGDVAELTASNTSTRIKERIARLAGFVADRSDSPAVRELQDRLVSCGATA